METSSTKCSSPADTDLKCREGMKHLFICSSCGDHLKYGLWDRLNEKIAELTLDEALIRIILTGIKCSYCGNKIDINFTNKGDYKVK